MAPYPYWSESRDVIRWSWQTKSWPARLLTGWLGNGTPSAAEQSDPCPALKVGTVALAAASRSRASLMTSHWPLDCPFHAAGEVGEPMAVRAVYGWPAAAAGCTAVETKRTSAGTKAASGRRRGEGGR